MCEKKKIKDINDLKGKWLRKKLKKERKKKLRWSKGKKKRLVSKKIIDDLKREGNGKDIDVGGEDKGGFYLKEWIEGIKKEKGGNERKNLIIR